MTFPPPFGRPRTWIFRLPAGLFLVSAIALSGCRRAESPPSPVESEVPVADLPSPPWTVTSDPVKIFQKAFWRSPTANDSILHAERREWPGQDGVGKWQWFLVVKPSPELLKYLVEDNAFGLVSSEAMPEIASAPAWFTFESAEVEMLQAPTANLWLIYSIADHLLYATDSGEAFRPGVCDAGKARPAADQPTSGRIPATPPPNPRLTE